VPRPIVSVALTRNGAYLTADPSFVSESLDIPNSPDHWIYEGFNDCAVALAHYAIRSHCDSDVGWSNLKFCLIKAF
jgi:hypothetical protein